MLAIFLWDIYYLNNKKGLSDGFIINDEPNAEAESVYAF